MTPALLLHGQPGRGRGWAAVERVIAGRVETIAPDRPGYGDNPAGATGFAGNARWALDLLEERCLDRAVVVAHSWAGGAAILLAAEHPERVAALVLAASVGPGCLRPWDRALARPELERLGAPLASVLHAARIWHTVAVEQRALMDELGAIDDALPGVEAPTTVVRAGLDLNVPGRTATALTARIPGARQVDLPRALHELPRFAPGALADLVVAAGTAGPA